MIRAACFTLLCIGASQGALAQTDNSTFDTRDVVTRLAFDPAKFFSDEGRGHDLVTFTYGGDDWAWPVYAIAIRNGCDANRAQGCHADRRARMVRAPAIEKMDRPRWRGSALIQKVADQKPATPERAAEILDTVGMEWMEADLKTCPNAMAVLAEGNSLIWVLPETLAPTPEPQFEAVLHADKVTVEFPHYLRKARYHGYMAKGSPAAWADKLAQTLEPCWRPAQAPVPWHQPVKATD